MDSKLTPKGCSLRILIGALLLIVLGCAAPKHKPEQFIGKWIRPPEGAAYPFILELFPDGTGITSGPSEPHSMGINWFLRRDTLVLAPRDGSPPTTYECRFNGPDELILIKDGAELAV
ncbi:MAG: hypothetical protein GTN78_04485, partial [Gemmatimonadales bacterium]|nr:hypothetical protein [Gemmatimonadales bacterium]